VGVEREPVDDGGDEARLGDDRAPLAERQIAGDGDGCFLFAFGEDLSAASASSLTSCVAVA
jgi:hypothetical protein